MNPILVICGTGTVGSQVLSQLSGKGAQVTEAGYWHEVALGLLYSRHDILLGPGQDPV